MVTKYSKGQVAGRGKLRGRVINTGARTARVLEKHQGYIGELPNGVKGIIGSVGKWTGPNTFAFYPIKGGDAITVSLGTPVVIFDIDEEELRRRKMLGPGTYLYSYMRFKNTAMGNPVHSVTIYKMVKGEPELVIAQVDVGYRGALQAVLSTLEIRKEGYELPKGYKVFEVSW